LRFIAIRLAFQAISPEFFERLRAIFYNFSGFSGENKTCTLIGRQVYCTSSMKEMFMRSSTVFVLGLFLSIF